MTLLILASLAFLITHLGVSSTPLRGIIVNAAGEKAYLGIYSVMAFATLGLMIYAYNQLAHADYVWAPGTVEQIIGRTLMPFAFIFVIGGLMVKNPTSVQMDAAVHEELGGMIRIVRHPLQWGILLWAISHILVNGDSASIIFFGSFALLSAVGMVAMDAKRRGRDDPDWQRFYAETSYFPFAAILTGKTSLKAGDLNWASVAIGIVLFMVVYVFHDWVSGVPIIQF
jgi:uncharacterized membrane protein